MARKLVPLEEAANLIGVSPDELNEMRQRQEIYGYRDGATWKFKPEDLDKLAEERKARHELSATDAVGLPPDAKGVDEGDDMVLLSEFELGSSGPSTSSTVIGKPGQGQAPADSDIKLATSGPAGRSGSDLPVDLGDDLPLDLGSSSSVDLSTEPDSDSKSGSDVKLGSSASLEAEDVLAQQGSDDESTVQLAGEDDVLAGSGPGSDITISPEDSGISLVDPSDSGLSLEEPIELSTADESSFDLSGDASSGAVGESSEFDSDAVVELKGEDDFLLTPLEEVTDEESQDSGSQVIALDSEAEFDDASPTVVTAGAGGVAMLEAEEAVERDPLAAAALTPGALATGPAMVVTPASQSQFSVGVIVGLSFCVLFLAFSGMMTYDLVRNMWSWDGPYASNSFIMDGLLSVFD